ncbi:uncharacterized protein [Eucyclogobius newberryi]|uniref:uncharacterized protein n=1 Tax=Eucyclogobius newberryi TaxID=166745 RepID=UPI003B5B5F6F
MEQKGDRLVCSSEDIYPQPNVSWTPDVRPQTLVKETQNQLHSISSSLTFDPLQQYTCNISTHHSWKSATYSVHTPMEMSRNVTIPCTTSVSPVKRLVWTFNYIEPIVTVSGADVDYAAPWRKFVKGVSEWGSLSLQELGSEQEGVYLCELHTDSHTHFSRTELRVHQDAGPNIGVIVGSVVGVALCVTFIIIFIMWKHKKETKSDPPEAEALLPLLPLDPREYSCEFSLDPNTAHRKLKLSEDNRTVTCVKEDQEEKFKNWPQVLSSTGLRGRCYWEVEWKGEGVSIAVSYKGIRRRGTEEEYVFGWNDQSWSLWTNGKQYFALHKHNQIKVGVVSGDWSLRSGRVGVFLDSEAGTLTFYKTYIDAKPSPLHTFYSSFTEPLFPGFELDPDSFVTVMDLKTAVKHPIIQEPKKYSCEFSLDPNTAHRKLKLSEDNRTVTCVKEDQEEKFKNWPQVLSSTGLRGRCYWEVEWKGEGVSIAVSYKGIRRRGTEEEYVFGWNDQSWSLWTNGKQYFALHKHNQIKVGVVSGDWSLRSGRVGVFLDSEAGTLTFYKTYIDAKPSPLHTFYSSFTEPLFPGFELDPDSFVTVMDLKTAVKHPIIQEPKKYSCEFSLDPNTTHRKLKLSEDNRTVSYEEEEQEYEEHEDRFTGWKQVLSSTGLRGRCYWEVEWEGEGVSIAVSYKGIKRRGKGDESLFGLNDQSWSLIMFGCCFFASHNKNKTVAYDFSPSQNTNRRSNTTTVGVSSIRVGVFLDSEAGTLTFYKICSDGENFPLHTFYSSFTEPLFPGFGLLPDSSVTVMDLKLSQAE